MSNQNEFEPTLDPFKKSSMADQNLEILEKKWKQIAKTNLNEIDQNMGMLIKELRDVIEKTDPGLLKNLPGKSDEFLVKILRAGGFDVKLALKALTGYVGMMRETPSYFALAFTKFDKIQKVFNMMVLDMSSVRDKFGRRVYLYRPGRWDPDLVKYSDIFCAGYMLCEMVSREEKTQIAGVTVILDGKNFGFKQFSQIGFTELKWTAHFAQDTFPLWFRAVHIINYSRLLSVAYNMIKPAFTQRIRDTVMFHDNNQSLHQFVSPEVLPKDLGGTRGPFNNATAVDAVQSIPDYFQEIKKYVYS